jgi:hypothetical protein
MENRKPSLDRSALKQACFDLAADILQERRPIDVEEIQELADQYFKIAAKPVLEEFILGQDRDPNLVLLVVHYLGHRHAIPPLRDDVRWFQEMFECLVELACPNCGGQEEDEQFFKEIEEGIATCRADYQQNG